jgi:hypothetical protein
MMGVNAGHAYYGEILYSEKSENLKVNIPFIAENVLFFLDLTFFDMFLLCRVLLQRIANDL